MRRRRDNEPRIYGPYPHGDQWRVHVVTRSGGKRTTIYQTFATRKLAEAFIAGARDEAQGVTVTAAVAAFLDAKRAKGREASTIESAEDRLAMIVGSLMQRPVRALNHRGAELYAAAQVKPNGKPRAADTHQNALSVAKDFGAFCVKRRWLRVNPDLLTYPSTELSGSQAAMA